MGAMSKLDAEIREAVEAEVQANGQADAAAIVERFATGLSAQHGTDGDLDGWRDLVRPSVESHALALNRP